MKDEELIEKILHTMPWLPEVLGQIVGKINGFDGRSPVTLMAEIEDDICAVAEKVEGTEGEGVAAFLPVLSHMAFPSELGGTLQECIHLVEGQVAADPRSGQLMRLIADADARVPFVSYLALSSHIDYRSLLRPLCLPGTLLEDAKKESGEAKATLLIDALGKTAEMLYIPYLRALWKLTCFARGKWPKEIDRFGSLVNELAKRLADYPGLLELSAGWMRNSARHERWYPIPSEDAVVMWDDKVPPQKVKISELEKIVERMYRMAGPTFAGVAQLYFFRDILSNTRIWESFAETLPIIFTTDWNNASKATAVEQEVAAKFENLRKKFEPLNAFLQVNGQADLSSQV